MEKWGLGSDWEDLDFEIQKKGEQKSQGQPRK